MSKSILWWRTNISIDHIVNLQDEVNDLIFELSEKVDL